MCVRALAVKHRRTDGTTSKTCAHTHKFRPHVGHHTHSSSYVGLKMAAEVKQALEPKEAPMTHVTQTNGQRPLSDHSDHGLSSDQFGRKADSLAACSNQSEHPMAPVLRPPTLSDFCMSNRTDLFPNSSGGPQTFQMTDGWPGVSHA